MARVTLSANISAINGSVQGTTYQQSSYGQIMRSKPTPIKTSNNAQSNIKLINNALNYQWAALTSSQRATWDGKIGVQFKTGKQAYLHSNFYLMFYGLSILTTPAFNVTPPPVDPFLLNMNFGLLELASIGSYSLATYQQLIKCSYPQGNTVTRARANMRLLNLVPVSSDYAILSPVYDTTLKVTPVAGMKIWVSVAMQNLTSGDVGAWTTKLLEVQ